MRREAVEVVSVDFVKANTLKIVINKEEIDLHTVKIETTEQAFAGDFKTLIAYVNFEKKLAIEVSDDDIDCVHTPTYDQRMGQIKVSADFIFDVSEKSMLNYKYRELFALWEPCDQFGQQIDD